MSVNQEFNNNRFRFKMPTNPTSSGSLRPVWNAGSIQSINVEKSTINNNDVIYYDATGNIWRTGPVPAPGAVAALDGTVTDPSISFAADLDTGLYRIGSDELGITTGGVLRLDISSTVITSIEPIIISDTTPSGDKDTGALIVQGGVGIEENLNVGGNVVIVGTIDTGNGATEIYDMNQDLRTDDAVAFAQVTVDQIVLNDSTVALTGTTGNNIISIPDNLADGFSVKEGSNSYMTFDTTNTFEQVEIPLSTTSTSTTTGALVVTGGVGIVENLNVGGNVVIVGTIDTGNGATEIYDMNQDLRTDDAVAFAQVTVDQIVLNDSTVALTGTTGNNIISIPDNLADGFSVKEGSNSYMTFDTTNTFEQVEIPLSTTSTSTTTGALVVTGGVGIVENLNVGGNVVIVGTIDTGNGATEIYDMNQDLRTDDAVAFAQVTVDQIVLNDSTVALTGTTGNNIISIPDNLADGFSVKEGANSYMTFDTTNTFEQVEIPLSTTSTSTTTGALVVTGGVGIVENLNVGGNLTAVGTIGGLTSTELTQLQNIDGTTISTAQWGWLGGFDQDLQTTDAVTFASVSVGANQIISSQQTAETDASAATSATLTDSSTGTASDTLALLTNTDDLTDNTGGTANDDVSDVSGVVTGADGTASNAALKTDVDDRLVSINNNFKELVDQVITQRTFNTSIKNSVASMAQEINALIVDVGATRTTINNLLAKLRTHGLIAT